MAESKNLDQTRNRKIVAILLLVLTTVLWGTSFILTKNITEDVPIFLYMGLRFAIAFLGFAPMFFRLKNLDKRMLLMGILTGMIYFFGFAIQTHGLQTTTAGKAGFVTGLSAIIVPFIAWLVFKKRPNWRIWIAVVLSISGMAFLLLEGEKGIIIGDLIVLISAFFWASFIIFNDKFVRQVDIYAYSIIQMLVISLASFVSSFILGESFAIMSLPPSFWYIMVYMGIGVMTLTIFFQNWGQQYQGATTTAMIFTLEPVFAALFGFIIGDEILTLFAWIGCGLIFIAILVTVVKRSNNED
ncbi:MAG: DMT family transporter [Promethearchaeota archaeon]|jgi:drug/metabolite transporter (DMT)-like permease